MTQASQHAADLIKRHRQGAEVFRRQVMKLMCNKQLRFDFAGGTLGVRKKIGEFLTGFSCRSLCNIRGNGNRRSPQL